MNELVETLTAIADKKTAAHVVVNEYAEQWEEKSNGCEFKLFDEALDCTHGENYDPFCTAETCPLINKEV